MDDESVTVTAGLAGFIVFFCLAVALWLLLRNMNARLRRMRYRWEQEEAARTATVGGPGGLPRDGGPPDQGPAPEAGDDPPGSRSG